MPGFDGCIWFVIAIAKEFIMGDFEKNNDFKSYDPKGVDNYLQNGNTKDTEIKETKEWRGRRVSTEKHEPKNLKGDSAVDAESKTVKVSKSALASLNTAESRENQATSHKIETSNKPNIQEAPSNLPKDTSISNELETPENTPLDNKQQVSSLVSKLMGLTPNSFSIKTVEPGLTTGLSGTPVYLVFDNDNKLLFVAKINDEKTASREAQSLNILSGLQIEGVNFPKLLNISLIQGDSPVPKSLVAQSAASGQSIDVYMSSVGASEGLDRQQKFEKLVEGINSSAKGIAALHNHKPRLYKNKDVENNRNKNISDLKSSMNQLFDRIDRLKVDNNLLSTIDTGKLRAGVQGTIFSTIGEYTHHDFHPGNVFYDPASKGSPITMIDNDGLIESLDILTNEPIGVGVQDAVYFSHWIAIQGALSGLDSAEVKSLQEAFFQTYRESRTGVDSDVLNSELEFMKIFVPMSYISKLQSALDYPQSSWYVSLGKEKIEAFITVLAATLK